MTDAAHSELIRDQFTRQATPFSTAAPIADAGALKLIVDAARAGPEDEVLDVACGGGIVVCAFAPHVRHATGIDMTPAMLERARALDHRRCLAVRQAHAARIAPIAITRPQQPPQCDGSAAPPSP